MIQVFFLKKNQNRAKSSFVLGFENSSIVEVHLPKEKFVAGEQHMITIATHKGNAREFIEVNFPMDQEIPAIFYQIVDKKDGLYHLSLIPTVTGKIALHISVGGVPVKDGPFLLQVEPG